jgi:hypothetical protein
MKRHRLTFVLLTALAVITLPTRAARLTPVDSRLAPELFVWTDTCNVYVLRDGDAALLLDLGNGSVLEHLGEIGVRRVEWVLFTHHHHEQCQGASRLKGTGAKVAAPEAERALLERPTDFRQMNVSLGDAFTIHDHRSAAGDADRGCSACGCHARLSRFAGDLQLGERPHQRQEEILISFTGFPCFGPRARCFRE